MANHCYNWINIQGKKENIAKLKAIFENEDFNLVAEAEVLFNIKSSDYYEDFGTRWFVVQDVELYSEEDLHISGDSAWSPPDAFLLKLSAKFDLTIVLEYEESGNDIAGTETYENGAITNKFNTTYQMWRYKQDGIEDIANNYCYDMNEYDTFENWLKDTIDSEVSKILTTEEREELEEIFNEAKN